MWNLNQDTRAVSGFYLGTSGASVFHTAKRTNAHRNDVMRLATFDINDK